MDQVDDNEVAGAPTGSGAKKPKSKVGSRIDNDKLTLLVALAYEKGGKVRIKHLPRLPLSLNDQSPIGARLHQRSTVPLKMQPGLLGMRYARSI